MVYQRLVQIVSGWVALCHFVLGLGGLFGDAAVIASLVRFFYGADIQIDSTLFYVAKLLSVYFLVFGALTLAIALRPRAYLKLVPIVIAFFLLRVAELIYFYRVVGEQFLVADRRLTEKIVSFAVIAVLLGVAAYRMRATTGAAVPQH
jgi:hypothetical protein